MKKKKGIVVFIVFLVIVAALAYYSYGIIKGTVAKDNEAGVKLGLDLSGGVSITYEAVGDTPSSEEMSDTVYKLQRRVETYSTEAEAYQVGDNRIAVEIPGVTDANEILEELGQPGSLEFETSDGEVFMTGDMVSDAQAGTYQDPTTGANQYVVSLTLTDEGKETFSKVTSENVGNILPIVFDDEVISSPRVQEAITDGQAQITGMESYEEAENLASMIRTGSLSVELKEVQSEVVGARLGSEAISTSIKAAAIGLVVVMIFMIAVYFIPGLAAAIALMIYTGLILAILHLYDITLTLPGIAGIILSIGMAVDANVIIFARIREEIAAGKSVREATQIGFKKALSAILDGNITTLIAAAVLGLRGSGTVKGFASTLAIGVILSMFTALVITRLILSALYGMGFKDKKFYGEKKERRPINFLGKRALFFAISAAVIVIGFAGMGYHKSANGNALNYSLEFVGGTSTTVGFREDYSIEEIDEKIVPVVEQVTGDANIQTQKVQDSNSVIIKTRDLSLDEREALNQALEENFDVTEDEITSTNISSTVSDEMKSDAVWAVVIAAICMLIYIWFRFKDVRFAGSAVFALIHDVLFVLTFYALSRTSVGNTFIACMLTIVGYSINATIVIFDRIREHLKEKKAETPAQLKEVVNVSITQTLSRSINTTLTTFITIFVLFLFGVSSIREFALPLIVGIVGGAYSSVCVTGAMWYTFKTGFVKRRERKAAAAVQPAGKKKKKK